jgi:uncharacterized protein
MQHNMVTVAALAWAAAIATTPVLAQDSSSWSSGVMVAPNQRPGEAKLLKNNAARKDLKPTLGPGSATRVLPPTVPSDASTTFAPAASDAVRGTGDLATTTVRKTAVGTDPAYDAFDQGRFLTAMELATKGADAGEPQAATLIGRLYQEGLGIKPDPVLAAQWYRRAAELGDLEGTFAFAVMLAEGEGIQKNRQGAAQLFDAAAQKGHALANYNLALLYLKGDGKPENPERAAMHLRYAAEQGVAAAQFDLAALYLNGTGVSANSYEAANWLEKAALQGHTDAEVELGVWLFQGKGMFASQVRGAQFFRLAADKGNAIAQNRLARCYASGAGVAPDLGEAAKWHFIAKAGGADDANLDETIKKLKPAERQAAQRAADQWRESALVR